MYNEITNYGEIIKSLRKKYKMTQSELGNIISVGKTAICNYETGYSTPSVAIMKKIANAFDLSLVEFLTYDCDNKKLDINLPRTNQATYDSTIFYLKPQNINTEIIESKSYMDACLRVPSFITDTEGDYICVKMPDNSMEGDGINKNDFLIIKKAKIIENRKIVLAIDNEKNDYIIRRYIRDGHIVTFIPSSTSENFQIIRADERDDRYNIIGFIEKAIINVK